MGYFDERDEAVLRAMKMLIKKAHKKGVTVSICGQAPSFYPEITEFLVKCGIDSISVNPDAVIKTKKLVYDIEKKLGIS
jgi:pyruvate,water dikinase